MKTIYDLPVKLREEYMTSVFKDGICAVRAEELRRQYGGDKLFIRFAQAVDRMKLAATAKKSKSRAPARQRLVPVR